VHEHLVLVTEMARQPLQEGRTAAAPP